MPPAPAIDEVVDLIATTWDGGDRPPTAGFPLAGVRVVAQDLEVAFDWRPMRARTSCSRPWASIGSSRSACRKTATG